jgi:phenylpropionate dioxygenase-like ring-hydroxylating dioxygenase large terminal subunit
VTEEADRLLWEGHWHLLCHRSEVAAPRDFLRFDVGRQEVVVFHDGASVVAFDNRCPHRGTRIFDASHGNQRFVCRYHGWSYAKGRTFVAGRETFAHCAIEEADLNRLHSEWLGDFLFVSKRPRKTLAEQLGGITVLLEAISRGIAQRLDFNSFIFEADWRIAVENALEPYHVAGIHPNTLNTLELQPGRNEYLGQNSIWYSEVGNVRANKMLNSLSRRFALPYQFKGYLSIYMFPFTMLSSTYGYSYSLQNFLPSKAPERAHFVSRLFASRLADDTKPALLASFFESSAALNRATFDEDHEICKRVPLDSWSPGPPRFWSTAEEKIVHFRQSYVDYFGELQAKEPSGFTVSP